MRFYQTSMPVLRKVLEALESNAIGYHWDSNVDSPMGLIMQGILSFTPSQLGIHFYEYSNYYDKSGWVNWVVRYWPINGLPNSNFKLLVRLHDAGFEREDIVEFENLSDETVLKALNLGYAEEDVFEVQTKTKMVPKFKELYYYEEHYRKDWWGRLWGLKENVKITVPVEDGVEEIEYTEKVKTGTKKIQRKLNPKSKEDFILYLKKYIEIYGKS